jgi:hypothetical protein
LIFIAMLPQYRRVSVESVSLIAGAVAGGVVTTTVQSWLTSRTKLGEELRQHRLIAYPPLWKLMKVVSRWPPTDATFSDLEQLHEQFRLWFFDVGGVYLSERARDRYRELQELLLVVVRGRGEPHEKPSKDVYDALDQSCSALRAAIADDLESRHQRSLITTLVSAIRHWKLGSKAKRRKKKIEASFKGSPRDFRVDLDRPVELEPPEP